MDKKRIALAVSAFAIEHLKQFEGKRLTAYFDAVKVPTIGYGHTKTVTADDVQNKKTITDTEAENLLAQDVNHFVRGVNRWLSEINVSVTQAQFDALVCFAYNVGLSALKKSTLAKKLYVMQQSDQQSIYAVADEFLRWNKAGGKVLQGLVRRRGAERLMFLGVR